MKNLIYGLAIVALGLFAASCQRENLEPVTGDNTVIYTVQVPGVSATKALGDDISAVTELHYEVYRTDVKNDAVFTDADNLLYHRTETIKNGVAYITLELVKDQNFTVLFWAQVPENGVYTVTDLTNVTMAQTADANQEKYAAFAGVDFIEKGESLAGRTIDLVRPVSQLNIATTPESLTAFEDKVVLNGSSVKVSGLSTSFNVATQSAGNDESAYEYAEKAVPAATIDVNGKSYQYIAMNYVGFAPAEGATVTVSYAINTSEGAIVEREISSVPVKPNYRTNIIGNLITSASDYAVNLDAEWGDVETIIQPDGTINTNTTVTTAEELTTVIENATNGDVVTLGKDIDLSTLVGMVSVKSTTPPYGLLIPYGKSLILDLNGFTISQIVEQTAGYTMIQNDGDLTIIDSRGNGKIAYVDGGNGGEYHSNTITNRGTLTVKSGSIENNSSEAMANVGYAYAIDSSIWGEAAETVTNIEGGTVKSIYSPLRVRADSQTENVIANISGGEIYGRIDHQMSSSKAGVKGTLNISGGTFNPYGITSTAIMVFGAGLETDASGIVLDITGGTFNAPINVRKTEPVALGQGFNEKFITGGTFTADPSANLVAGNYALKYDDETYYRVYDNFDPANRTFTVNSREELLRLTELSAKWADFFSNGEGTAFSNYAEQNGGKGTDFYYYWGWTIKLTTDIDFEGTTINPINLGHRAFFDGQGHTIKNAKIETSSDAGLFDAAQCGLKNLVIENVQVKTYDNGATAGILASSCNAGVDNITITKSSVYGGKYTGGVVGYGYSDVTNCNLTDCEVSGSYKCGGVIGYICASGDQIRKVDNNTLTDCIVNFTGTLTDGKTEFICGMVVGNYNCVGTCDNNTIDNITTVATGLIGKTEAAMKASSTGSKFYVANTEALQAALDNATEGTIITLTPNVSYGVVYMGRPTKHNATTMYCETHDYTITNAAAFKNHLAEPSYHTTPKYTTILSNLTVVGAEGAKIAGLLATSGHAYGDVYDYVLDKDYESGSAYYNTLYLSNILFSQVNFTGKIDINTSDATSVYDGVTFDGCTFTTGGTASSNSCAVRYYNESNNGNVKNIVVKNCSFTNSYQGVYVQNVNGVTVTDCKFDTTGHNAIAIQSTSEPVNLKNVVIKANNFNNIKDRVIRFGAIGTDSNITIQNNIAVNSGDEDGEVMKAVSIEAGITTFISGNNWGEGKVVANDELKDK